MNEQLVLKLDLHREGADCLQLSFMPVRAKLASTLSAAPFLDHAGHLSQPNDISWLDAGRLCGLYSDTADHLREHREGEFFFQRRLLEKRPEQSRDLAVVVRSPMIEASSLEDRERCHRRGLKECSD